MYQEIDGVRVWGNPQADAVRQAAQCARVGDVAAVALMADHHKGYSQPIGEVVMAGADVKDPYKDQQEESPCS